MLIGSRSGQWFMHFSISLPFISEKKCIFYYIKNTQICQLCPFSSDTNNKLVKGELVHMLVHSATQYKTPLYLAKWADYELYAMGILLW